MHLSYLMHEVGQKSSERFSSTGAKNEHTPGGQAEMRNGFVRHGLCRAHPQAAPVCTMSPALSWKELAGGKRAGLIMHSRQQMAGELCTPRGSGRMMERGACGVNQSAGCPQVGAGDRQRRANWGGAKPAAQPPVFPSSVTEKLAPIICSL